ncbi:predicted protein [Sclerotinia sclerotiorum 1980 UF-70]|uniref:Uncharacterized protein n=1 Tax=Sclerotinia sclerotiorum (strain ATCC 18683 / 1980 / Ss-1) TaxID=665079 RepID=A7EW62_SCLS1|nr:predicted protein [Sclerotinia sclerotiorum 1980 UF-70]EDN93704.1 predicted protein [Sclerotinia sclerotiorum 1980 UF-70]
MACAKTIKTDSLFCRVLCWSTALGFSPSISHSAMTLQSNKKPGIALRRFRVVVAPIIVFFLHRMVKNSFQKADGQFRKMSSLAFQKGSPSSSFRGASSSVLLIKVSSDSIGASSTSTKKTFL